MSVCVFVLIGKCKFVCFCSVTNVQLEPLAAQLLSNLFAILEKPVSEENEYVMKGLFVVFVLWREIFV